MKSVLIDKVTDSKDIELTEVAIPSVKDDWVLVKVKAFGINHSKNF